MSPSKSSSTDKTDEAEVAQAEAKAAEPRVSRDVVVSVEVTTRTDDPDVTDDVIAAAAQEQITLPNTIWVDKPEGGQIAVAVVTVAQEPEEPPEIP
jgi:hypothetical protein